MIKLVVIENNKDGTYNYKRYDGRKLTHQAINQRELGSEEVEKFRKCS